MDTQIKDTNKENETAGDGNNRKDIKYYIKPYSLIYSSIIDILPIMEIPKLFASLDGGSNGKPKLRLNPNLSFYADYWRTIDPIDRHAINQYHAIAGAHNLLWEEIYKRTTTKAWEQDQKGVGSCDIPDAYATDGLDSVFTFDLIQLRNRRSNETPINGRLNGCPHHREGVGCVLKELKGPKCLDYIDLYIDDEIERRFGVCLMPIKPYLDRVGLAGADQNIIPLTLHPEVNDEFTLKTIGAINQVTDYIKGFPILPK